MGMKGTRTSIWWAKTVGLKRALGRLFRAPDLQAMLEDQVLMEGAPINVRWRSAGALFVVVKGYGRCRTQGTMRVVVQPPQLDLVFSAFGLFRKRTVRVQRRVRPLALRSVPYMAAPFRARVEGPVPTYAEARLIRSAALCYGKPLPSLKHDLPVIHGRMPGRIEIEEPELDQHHGVQGLLNA